MNPTNGNPFTHDTLLVSFNWERGEGKEVMLVGHKNNSGAIEVLNCFSGETARKIYEKLTKPSEGLFNEEKTNV